MAAALGVLVSCGSVKSGEEVVAASRDSKVVVAYVTSWSEVMPDPAVHDAYQLCVRSCKREL